MSIDDIQKIALKLVGLLAEEKVPVGYIENIFNTATEMIMRETITKKIE